MDKKNSIYDKPVEIRLARAKSNKTDKETLTLLGFDKFWFR